MSAQLVMLNIGDIVVKSRIRDEIGDLSALESSIKHFGLLFPVVVNQDKVLISGMRRLEACKKLGHTQIQAIVVEVKEGILTLEMECQENLCRKELTPQEVDKIIEMKLKYVPQRYIKTGTFNVLGKIWDKISGIGK